MRISELGEATGVPVHTLKYYLREGILMPGRPPCRAPAPTTVTSTSSGCGWCARSSSRAGCAIAGVRAILEALDAPPPSRHDLLGVAACAMPDDGRRPPGRPGGGRRASTELGWQVAPDSPALRSLSAALSAAEAAGVGLSPALLRDYAEPMRGIAEVDLRGRRARPRRRSRRCARSSSAP